jgi:hypothetical protein
MAAIDILIKQHYQDNKPIIANYLKEIKQPSSELGNCYTERVAKTMGYVPKPRARFCKVTVVELKSSVAALPPAVDKERCTEHRHNIVEVKVYHVSELIEPKRDTVIPQDRPDKTDLWG